MLKLKLDDQTKANIQAYTISGALLILFFFILKNISLLYGVLGQVSHIIGPFIIGFFIAFILNPVNVFLERKLFRRMRFKERTRRILSSLLTLILFMTFLTLFILTTLPQLTESLVNLINIMPDYISSAEGVVGELLSNINVNANVADILSKYSDELFNTVIDLASQYLPQLLDYSIKIGSGIIRFFIGLVVALYILIDKERFVKQFKTLDYAYLSQTNADKLVEFSRVCSRVFNNFIIGKILDSLIIGFITYLGLLIMQIPYALLLSFIIGVTNLIPVFGPLIGALPGIFILFIVDPVLVVWFTVFIIVLQQIDGNIIGPAILGDTLGLPSLWIMFAIIVGGGFYGILGMFFGVPVFAVIYFYIKKSAQKRLIIKRPDMK